jgi:hypothetical protein
VLSSEYQRGGIQNAARVAERGGAGSKTQTPPSPWSTVAPRPRCCGIHWAVHGHGGHLQPDRPENRNRCGFMARSQMAASRTRADQISAEADMPFSMSAVGGKADVPATWPGSPLLAKNRHSDGRRSTSALLPEPDIQTPMSGFPSITSGLPPSADVSGSGLECPSLTQPVL